MRIQSIEIENFRCYEHKTFQFGDRTEVYGRNGAGKSSLPEAVVWCLFGTNILGKTKQDESLMRIGAKNMAVAVTFVDASGKQRVVARTRQGKKGSVLTVNGMLPEPGEIEGMFGSVPEFLSVFLPGYFSSLEPKDAKAILAKCVPEISKEEVLERMSPEASELLAQDRFVMGIDSIDYATKKLRDEVAEFQRELVRAEGEMDAYTEILKQDAPIPFESTVSESVRAQYESSKREILKQEVEAQTRDSRLAELQKKYNQLQQKYREVLQNAPKVDTHCFTCGQPLPADKVHAVREKARREHEEKLADIVQQGKAVRVDIDKLQSVTRHTVDERLVQHIQEVEQQLNKEQQLQAEYTAAVKNYQRAKDSVSKLTVQIERDKEILANVQSRLKVLHDFRFEYVRAQHEKLNGLFENVRIHLVDANKDTGEIREAFRVEWKGRPYRLLSFSEKVRCDLEIGRVMAWARGEEMPVYVDNAESVQNLFAETFNGQVIAAFVADTQLTLTQHDTKVA